MKWLAVLAVVMGLGGAALFLRSGPGQAPGSPAASLPPAAPTAVSGSTPPPLAHVRGPWQRIELRGLLVQHNNAAASQALLSLDGQRAELFHTGEQVLPGWALESIRQDHVLVGNGVEQHRLDVVQAATGLQAAAAAPPSASASANKEVPLPGFIPTGPPSALPPVAPSVETNRRFLQDRQNRATGR